MLESSELGFGMTLKTTILAAGFSVMIVATAQTATLVPTAGDVYDRTGSGGFHRVTSATEVQPGDTVMAGPNGSAQITLSDGFVITVGPGQTVIVPEKRRATDDPDAGKYLLGGAFAAIIGTGLYETFKKDNNPSLPASP